MRKIEGERKEGREERERERREGREGGREKEKLICSQLAQVSRTQILLLRIQCLESPYLSLFYLL